MTQDKETFETEADRGVPKWPTNVPEIELPGGHRISIADLIYESLRSAFIVRPWGNEAQWHLFSYSGSQLVAGAGTDVSATRAHTNIPRSGDSGLPRDWEALIYRWRASLNVPLEQPVLDWASETTATLVYNGKHYSSETLADLVLGACTFTELPVHLREHLGYRVIVETGSPRALDALRTWLRGAGSDATRDAVTELGAIARLADGKIAEALHGVQTKLQPGRNLTGWIHLEGLLKRCIV